jgi:ferritin-like metal-binding protein YciE
MKIMTLDDLFLDQLQDMHSSERQILKAPYPRW